jgi:hypothetical protein
MVLKRNVGLVPFGFTRACADRIATHLIDDFEAEVYAAWYWHVDPNLRDERNPYKGPLPDGIAVWTSRRLLLISLRFGLGSFWITDAAVEHEYPTGEPLPVLVTSGRPYDVAMIHGVPLWFAHGCVPAGFS